MHTRSEWIAVIGFSGLMLAYDPTQSTGPGTQQSDNAEMSTPRGGRASILSRPKMKTPARRRVLSVTDPSLALSPATAMDLRVLIAAGVP